MYKRLWAWSLLLIPLVGACGRYFHTPLQPASRQAEGMTINDDGSIAYALDRLSIELKPMTDAELNRLAPGPDPSVNPYTFGEWTAPGDTWTPPRFTVFRLKVRNYQFPKVEIDPLKARITAANTRQYQVLSYAQLYHYFRSYWLGRTGQGRKTFQARTDALKRTLYSGALVFSGSEEQGYVVFPRLADDVRAIQVHLADIVLRFDYADEPVEAIDLSFSFERDILQGYDPSAAVRINR